DAVSGLQADLRGPGLRGPRDLRSAPLGGADELRRGGGPVGHARRHWSSAPRISHCHPGRRAAREGSLGEARAAGTAGTRGCAAMSDERGRGGRRPEPDETGRLDVEDDGQTLEAVLEEEERSAIAAAEEKLKAAQTNLEELKDRHLRKLAEFENMRKRAEREKNEYFRHALANFLLDLFPISDGFDRALAHASEADLEDDFGQGVAMIRRQLDE